MGPLTKQLGQPISSRSFERNEKVAWKTKTSNRHQKASSWEFCQFTHFLFSIERIRMCHRGPQLYFSSDGSSFGQQQRQGKHTIHCIPEGGPNSGTSARRWVIRISGQNFMQIQRQCLNCLHSEVTSFDIHSWILQSSHEIKVLLYLRKFLYAVIVHINIALLWSQMPTLHKQYITNS